MALFGRKSNQQSGMNDVPPELQPYYQKQTTGDRLRHAALFVLPALVVLLLIGGAVWGLLWLNHHRPTSSHPNASSQTAQDDKRTQPSGNTSSPQPSGQSQSGSTNSPTADTGNNSSSGSSSSPSSSTSSTSTPGTSGSSSTAGGGAIPSTGPDAVSFVLPGLAMIGGAIAYRSHQVRRARQNP